MEYLTTLKFVLYIQFKIADNIEFIIIYTFNVLNII